MKRKILDSWKRPVEVEVPAPDPRYQQQLELQLNKTREATPEEVKAWQNGGDYFMTGKFDAMKLFVVAPAIIQFTVIGGMLLAFFIIGLGLKE